MSRKYREIMHLQDFGSMPGEIPSQSEEIFEKTMQVLNSEEYRKIKQFRIDEQKKSQEEYRKSLPENTEFIQTGPDYHEHSLRLIALLNETGYTEEAFRVLISEACSGFLEDPFVIGNMLRNNGCWGSWENANWDSMMEECDNFSNTWETYLW